MGYYIEKKGAKKYRIQIIVDNVRTSFTFEGTKAEAKIVAQDAIEDMKRGGSVITSTRPKWTEWVDTWSDRRAAIGKASSATIKYDRQFLHRLGRRGGFAKSCIDRITPDEIASLMADMRKDRSGWTVHQGFSLIKRTLESARKQGLIEINPADLVPAPSKPNQRNAIDYGGDDLARIHKAILETYENGVDRMHASLDAITGYRTALWRVDGTQRAAAAVCALIALETGARLGEILALDWDHVDIKGKTIRIDKGVGKDKTIKGPKTEASVRTVSIGSDMATILAKWRMEVHKAFNPAPEWVIISSTGDRMDSGNYGREWRRIASLAGCEGVHTHDLRHAQATLLIAKGFDVKTVQKRLGHASASTTLDIYATSLPNNDGQCPDAILDAILSRPRK